MTRYVRKSTQVNAIQYVIVNDKDDSNIDELREFVGDKNLRHVGPGEAGNEEATWQVYDERDGEWNSFSDTAWIIMRPGGSYYPCEDSAFNSKYELAQSYVRRVRLRETASGQVVFQPIGNNGEPQATSEPYASEGNAKRGAHDLLGAVAITFERDRRPR